MNRHPIRTFPIIASLLLLLGGCVKKSEYDALQIENQTLQTRVDQTNRLLQQSQAELSALQIQMQQFAAVQAQLQKTEQELKLSQEELNALKTKFEQFRTQRRSAMVGKKFPVLNLDDGKILREAEITALNADELAIRHADGFLKVAMAKASDDLRWQFCYDPQEAREALRGITVPKSSRPPVGSKEPENASPPATYNAVEALHARLAAQRKFLNAEYQALAAKNPGALRGAAWNSVRPEASPLLNSLSAGRAVLGISRLQSMRDAIFATLQQLREVDPASR